MESKRDFDDVFGTRPFMGFEDKIAFRFLHAASHVRQPVARRLNAFCIESPTVIRNRQTKVSVLHGKFALDAGGSGMFNDIPQAFGSDPQQICGKFASNGLIRYVEGGFQFAKQIRVEFTKPSNGLTQAPDYTIKIVFFFSAGPYHVLNAIDGLDYRK